MKINQFITLLVLFLFPGVFLSHGQSTVTTGSLVSEMADLERLSTSSNTKYRSFQFSSYDRRSVSPDKPGWYANADGFGNEPIPAFEKTLKEPDADGVGEYLICDVKEPGAIVRLWTARIGGTIKMFLDGKKVFDGSAEKFFWEFPKEVGNMDGIELNGAFRQYDALYFPIPFAKSCRIEWSGKLTDLHFYHVGFRLYDKSVKVKTFQPEDLVTYRKEIELAAKALTSPDAIALSGETQKASKIIQVGQKQTILKIDGSRAIEQLKIKINTLNPNVILRQAILRIFFDDASIPQVESPVGDFFGAAPGINPYVSLPLSVDKDGTMTCRFVMPFEKSALIQIENMSGQEIDIEASASSRPYAWNNNSLYFRALWRINHGLKSSVQDVIDLPYLLAMGEGRIVGAACYLMNPSSVPSANGNWWGEGDEKIFVDNDVFPSFFGTGSEDYYNYSWSNPSIFFYPYCGQPRNDGPDTRGFVTNFRWHIIDDIPYKSKAAFYMELYSHEVEVPGFIYARMIYNYAKAGLLNDHSPITADDVRPMEMPVWNPVAYRGSIDYRFVNAEVAFRGRANTSFEYDPIWAGGKIFVWKPQSVGEKINFEINTTEGKKDAMISFGHMPGAGKVKIYVNDKPVSTGVDGIIELSDDFRTLNRSHSTGSVDFVKGRNIITLENLSPDGAKIPVDFLWIKD